MKTIDAVQFVSRIRLLLDSTKSGFVEEQLPYLSALVERIEKHEVLTASAIAVAWNAAVRSVRAKQGKAIIFAVAEQETLVDLMAATVDDPLFASHVIRASA